ncbi:unnamed protein product [Mytilus edulis]|uniref:Endonuclease/exonuclease/phosphatase domain-containing protein n=1 Tax=Mytilus edulis TaxID=6550 RepID=A0A8S3QW67_MYTED|nr:unnamed protein product [Mytilus edulis]
MVQGDFNAHTNTSPDYVLFDESKQPYVVDNYYVEDSIMPRNNLDPKRINNSGRCLLDLCKETSLTILNGRTVGDLHGKFIWSPGAIESYVKDITSKENKTKLALFTNNSFKSSDSAVQSLTSILYESAKKSAKLVNKMPHRKIIKSKRKPWFSDSCNDLRKTVKSYEKLVNKFPYNNTYRKSFYSCRSKYRRACKKAERSYKNKICSEISANVNKDPKTFWNLLQKLSKSCNNEDSVQFAQDEFISYFKKLNKTDESFNPFQEKILKNFETLFDDFQKNNRTNDFQEHIKTSEIVKAITEGYPLLRTWENCLIK